tara:strand:+ start:386 stop:814 length:429 start_codon:yes stop_codon:yes gene_type:complete
MANWQSYGVGLHNVGSYQAAGTPYITGSAGMEASGASNAWQDKIEFPMVTKSITIINTSANELRVHFADAKTDTTTLQNYHYIALPANKDSMTMNVKCSEIYITNHGSAGATYTLFAELTQIPANKMYELSGSGINEDMGWR